jgi:hypothetical protein
VEYRELFEKVGKYPRMYLRRGTYDEAVAFVLGCDAGNAWGLLTGFDEWLVIRLDGPNNLAWTELVLDSAFPGEADYDAALLRPGGQDHALKTLVELLTAFLDERKKRDGLRVIFDGYEAWVRRQPWSREATATAEPKKRPRTKHR